MLALYLAYLDDEGDKRLFEEIFFSYRKQMVVLAFSIIKNADDAQDVVGDVFLRIAQKHFDTVREIKDETDLRNYLLKATKNASLNKIKANNKNNISVDTVTEYNIGGIEKLSDEAFVDMICNKFEYEHLLESIRSLNEKYCDVMYYHFVMELTVPETAKALNQKLSVTKQQLVRGKKMLLNLLKDKEVVKNGNE